MELNKLTMNLFSGGSDEVVFVTITTTVTLKDSDGNTLAGGTTKHYQNGWSASYAANTAVELLPGNHTFKMYFNNGTQQINNEPISGGSDEVAFVTVSTNLGLEACDGTLLADGTVKHYQNGWSASIAANSVVELLPGNYTVKMYYHNGTQQFGAQNIAGTEDEVLFVATQVNFSYPGVVKHYQNGWGTYYYGKYLLPGNYTFKFDTYQTPVTISGCSMSNMVAILILKDHNGSPLAGGTARGGSGSSYWSWFVSGSTNSSGILIDFRSGAYTMMSYEVKFNNTTAHITQDVTINPVFEFQTDLITLRLETCDGAPLNGGSIGYGPGSSGGTWWFPGGATGSSAPGESTAELFPGTYSFRMQYKATTEFIYSWDFPGDGSTVTWQTTNVTLIYDGTISYGGATGDATYFIKPSMELLHGTYTFHFRYDGRVDLDLVDCDLVYEPIFNQPPVAVCQDVTVNADSYCEAMVSADAVDNGSYDPDEDPILLELTPEGPYPLGITEVTLMVTNDSGETDECTATIIVVDETPPFTINQSESPEYCQGGAIVLTADAPEAISYSWSNGGNEASTEVFASDTYIVTIINSVGCENTSSITVDYVMQDLLSAYTIIGMDEVHLHNNSQVSNGGVGVMNANRKAKIHGNTTITGPTTFVMADVIEIKNGATVATQIIGQPTITLPTFLYGTPGNLNIHVDKNTTMTLDGTAYKKVDVKKNATVVFTANDVSLKELHCHDGATVEFEGCSYLRIEKKMHLHKNNTFNPSGEQVNVFIEMEKADIKEGSTINGSIYALNHEIKVKGKSNNITHMNGAFIGKKVKGEKGVSWDWNTDCGIECPDNIPYKGSDPVIAIGEETKQNETDFDELINDNYNLNNYPNPFNEQTTITFTISETNNATLKVYDSFGKEVATLFNGLAEEGQQYMLNFNSENLQKGIYIYHLQSGNNISVVKKMILMK